MNYDAFMEPVSWFLTGMEKHSDRAMPEKFGDGKLFFDTMRYNMVHLPENALDACMNQLSNHDHSRFLTRTNRRVGRIEEDKDEAGLGVDFGLFRLGAMLLFTWPGAPTLFYGDEVGVYGWTEPDCRRPFPWGEEDMELLDYHRYLVLYHKTHPSLGCRERLCELCKRRGKRSGTDCSLHGRGRMYAFHTRMESERDRS